MITKFISTVWNQFLTDNLFRNSIYLMLTTIAMGLFGFVFWTIATHIFTPEEIGLGTTIISSMTMISYMSLFGFNNTLVRFLPTSNNKNRDINTAIMIIIIASVIISIAYVFLIPLITPNLDIIRTNIFYIIAFVILVTATSLNSLTDSIFVAYRKAQYNLITDGFVISISKIILPIIFVSLGAYGVFLASGLATFVGLAVSLILLVYKFEYIPKFMFNKESIKEVMSYSFSSYIGNLFSIAPTLLLPIIIINKLGSAEAGYFYLSFMVINLLYTVATSISQSLFAEGSYGESILLGLLKRSVLILIAILVPASIVLAWFGPLVLQLFGKTYSAGAANLIIILALSSPIIAAFNLGSTLLKIRRQMRSLIFVNGLYAVTICSLAFFWVSKGLEWVAFAWIIGNLIAAICAFILIYLYRHLPTLETKAA